MTSPDRFSAASIAAFFAISATGLIFSCFKIVDADVFWHLKAGLVALDRGRWALDTNVFSNSFPDHAWLNPYGLFQRGAAIIFLEWGWAGLSVAKILVVVALAHIVYQTVRLSDPGRPAAWAFTAIVLAIIQFRFVERPYLLSVVFFAVTVLVLERARMAGARPLWFLPPLFALWSNIHPELSAGLLLIIAAAAGAKLEALRRGPGPGAGASALACAALACAAATLLNPVGHRVLGYTLMQLQPVPGESPFHLTEYRSSSPLLIPQFWAYILLVALAFWRRRRDQVFTDVATAAGFLLAALMFVRLVPYFVIATVPVVAREYARTTECTAGTSAAARRIALVAVTAGFILYAVGFDRLLPYRFGVGLDWERVPEAAARAALANKVPEKLYNVYDDGGYLLFRLYPQMGIFQDGRGPAYPDNFNARLTAEIQAGTFQGRLERTGVETALIPILRVAPLGFTPERWGMVFWDDRWCVLVRRRPEHASLLERIAYRIYLPGAAPRTSPGSRERRLLVREMERNQRERLVPSALIASELQDLRGP